MPTFDLEKQHKGIVAGVDEAGLGPLAGPIVVSACIIVAPDDLSADLLSQIDDSKKLTPTKREKLFEIIRNHKSFVFNTAIVPPDIIDKLGLSVAWKTGIAEAVDGLKIKPDVCLIDGNRPVSLANIETYSVVKGDQKSFTIASASIIAKVTRDRIMQEIHKELPQYGFNKHVGYGTKAHLEALEQFGISKYHRKSYAPVKRLISR